MERIKIGYDEQKINECDNAMSQYLVMFAEIKKEYDGLGLRQLNSEDLPYLLDGDNFIKDVMLEGSENANIGGIKLSKNKMRELIEIPNTTRLKTAIERLIEFEKTYRQLPIFMNDFKIQGGKILFPDWRKVVSVRCTIWISGPERVELFQTIEKICEVLNSCKHAHSFIGFSAFINPNRHVLLRDGLYVPNTEFLRRA